MLEGVRKTQPGTQLTNLGCSGETTTSMLRGGLCRYPEGSQIAAAVAFLKGNAATTRLITLDMGANNVLRCARPALDQACATSTTTTAARELATILGQIRAAAPSVPIVVLTYYNPLLAGWLTGPEGRTTATQSQALLGGLNAEITKAAKAAKAKVADVAGAFATTDGSGSPQPRTSSASATGPGCALRATSTPTTPGMPRWRRRCSRPAEPGGWRSVRLSTSRVAQHTEYGALSDGPCAEPGRPPFTPRS